MPAASHYNPITVYRYLSLFQKYGDDDYFSSYLTDAELVERLGHFTNRLQGKIKVLVAYSMKDEYVPESVDKRKIVDRLTKAIGTDCCQSLCLESGDHALSYQDAGAASKLFVKSVLSFIEQ